MEEVVLLSLYIGCLVRKVKKSRKPRTQWSREWLLKRKDFSHVKLLKELQNEPNDWRNYLRMDEETYVELLSLVSPFIAKCDTVMRKAVSPHERLSATLRFLATGRSLKDMEYSTAISRPALSKIVPETCEAIYEVLKQYIQKVSDAEGQGQDEEVLRMERQVSRHFSYLHGLLQTQEAALRQQLRDSQVQRHAALEKTATNLETSVKDMESILMHCKSFLNVDNLSSMPLCYFLEKLKTSTAMPCHLVNIHKDDTSKLEFKVDERVIEMLKSHCTLSVPERTVYELRSKLDLPDDYMTDEILKAPDKSDPISNKLIAVMPSKICNTSLPQLPNTEAKTKKNLPEVNKNREMLQKQNKPEIKKLTFHQHALESICNIAPLFEGTTEIVKVCHFVTPNNFYVQRKIAFNFIEALREHFSYQATSKTPNNIELGQMYLVLFPADKKWYRGVLKRIDEEKNCEIFYLDYGNKEKVHISKLRDIPEQYIKVPGQAVHCSLYSCAPIGSEWSGEVFTYMATMSQNVELSMYVERINQTSGLHEVHLRNVEDFNGSFTDAMVFLGCAHRTESTVREEGLYKSSTKKTFFKDVSINKGETFDAHVTHINTPTNFYIQKVTDGGRLMNQLNKELKATYSRLGANQALVYSPTVGMPVAVKYKDGDWYRGQVLDIPEPKCVEVLYVDYGNVEKVQWTYIRTLQSKFLRTGAQGLKCALSDVAPTHSKGWHHSAKDAFERMTKKLKILRAYVEEVQTTGLSIILYDTTKNEDICFNGLLVKKGHAKSVGPSSAHAVFPREVENQSESDSLSTTSSVPKTHGSSQAELLSTVIKFLEPLPLTDDDQPKSSLTSIANSETSLSHTVTESELEDDSVRVKIMVLKVVTPGEIYVTFESLHQNIRKLTKQMTQYYGEGVTDDDEEDVFEDREWRVDDLCAVLKNEDKNWYRGVIKDVGLDNYKVFIKDIVEQVSVSKAGLRSLAPEFTTVLDGSVQCHLGGLKPPGRSKFWPAGACDVIIATVHQHENHLYMTKLGDLVNDSLPIQLLAKKEKVPGALDPIKEEWEDIGQKVIDLGFANRDHESNYLYTRTSQEDENHSNFESQRSIVLKWLNHSYEEDEINKPDTTTFPRQIRINPYVDITQWVPAEPFKKLDFIAVPTYVDFECAIYLQDYKSSYEKLDLIERALLTLFDGSTPKPHDLVWSKGQICCAYYEPDGKWYRAEVLNVTEEHIEVIFVDYGNTEFVQPEQLRKQISMGQIPIQCHRCLTDGLMPISPDDKWPIRTLDFIHGTIVTKECRVRLKPPTETSKEYVILNLNVPGGEELMDVLLSMHYATYVIDCDTLGQAKSEVDGREEDNTLLPVASDLTAIEQPIYDWFDTTQQSQAVKKLTLKEFVLPDSVVELKVQVRMICTTPQALAAFKVNIEECEDEEVILVLEKFQDLHDKIQSEAEEMPIVLDPYKGMVCIGCFSEDDGWYRAIITEVYRDENLVMVIYVDYGNAEKIPIDRLREMKEEWSELPKQAIHVALYGVREGRNYDLPSVQNMLTGCLKDKLTMVIEDRQPSLQVVLYNDKGELAYQSLFDLHLLDKCD